MATKVIFEGTIYSSRAFPKGTPESKLPELSFGARGEYDVGIDLQLRPEVFEAFISEICKKLHVDSVDMTLKGLKIVIAIE